MTKIKLFDPYIDRNEKCVVKEILSSHFLDLVRYENFKNLKKFEILGLRVGVGREGYFSSLIQKSIVFLHD